MSDDQQIVNQVLSGNRQAYAKLVDKYKSKLYAHLYRMLGQHQDTQDLLQEVFIKAYFHLAQFQPGSNFSAWLHRIAANHCLDELRGRKRAVVTVADELELVQTKTPEEAFLQKEGKQQLIHQIMSLEEEYRSVFVLRYIEHLSYKEISEMLSLPMTTVQMRLHRARKKLREALEERGGSGYEMSSI